MSNLYAVLRISRRATSAEIKAAYRALAKQAHPDVNAADEHTEERIRELNAAYDILGDPELRAAYDQSLADHRAGARRAFWRAAGIGATTSALAASCVWAVLVARHSTSLQQNRVPVATAASNAQDPAKPGPSEVVDAGGLGDPANAAREPAASLHAARETQAEPESDLSLALQAPAKEIVARASPPSAANEAAPPEAPSPAVEERQTPAEPIARPPATLELAGAPTSAPRSRMPPGEVELATAAPGERAEQREKIAYAPPPERGEQAPAPTIEQGTGHTPAARTTDTRTARVAPVHNKSARPLDTPKPTEAKRGNGQALRREAGLVSRTTAALRFPNADEPFVNVGGRTR